MEGGGGVGETNGKLHKTASNDKTERVFLISFPFLRGAGPCINSGDGPTTSTSIQRNVSVMDDASVGRRLLKLRLGSATRDKAVELAILS